MAGYSVDLSILADSNTPHWLPGSRLHEHNRTSSGSLARTCPSDMVGHSVPPASRLCMCRIHLQDYILPRWHIGRWRYILDPRFPQSNAGSSQDPASLLYKSRSRQQASSQ